MEITYTGFNEDEFKNNFDILRETFAESIDIKDLNQVNMISAILSDGEFSG